MNLKINETWNLKTVIFALYLSASACTGWVQFPQNAKYFIFDNFTRNFGIVQWHEWTHDCTTQETNFYKPVSLSKTVLPELFWAMKY